MEERFGVLPGDDITEEYDWESDIEEEKSREFQPEARAYERVGISGSMLGDFSDIRMVQDPSDRFIIYVDAISRKLMSEDTDLDENDLTTMLTKAREIPNIGYKNPTAYVLGYIASSGGRKNLVTKNVTKVINDILPKVHDVSVTPPDIIRYIRLWQSLV